MLLLLSQNFPLHALLVLPIPVLVSIQESIHVIVRYNSK
jgi:hypothetical protein